MDELNTAEKLLVHCEKNLLFEPHDWKTNDIKWKSQLNALFTSSEDYAKIRIYKMSLAINKKRNDESPKEKR